MPSPEPTQVHQLKVTLRHIRPPIWRGIQVRGDTTLNRLHAILQRTMGWEDCHLHQFEIHGKLFGPPDPDGFLDMNDEHEFRLANVAKKGTKFRYDYDFGDNWEHDIVVENIFPPEPEVAYPVCIKGERSCPPEDCGGPWGYLDLLEALGDPSHERHEELADWYEGELDPEQFDASVVNELLAPFRQQQVERRSRRKPKLRLVKR